MSKVYLCIVKNPNASINITVYDSPEKAVDAARAAWLSFKGHIKKNEINVDVLRARGSVYFCYDKENDFIRIDGTMVE